jgi:hypothetical protein
MGALYKIPIQDRVTHLHVVLSGHMGIDPYGERVNG